MKIFAFMGLFFIFLYGSIIGKEKVANLQDILILNQQAITTSSTIECLAVDLKDNEIVLLTLSADKKITAVDKTGLKVESNRKSKETLIPNPSNPVKILGHRFIADGAGQQFYVIDLTTGEVLKITYANHQLQEKRRTHFYLKPQNFLGLEEGKRPKKNKDLIIRKMELSESLAIFGGEEVSTASQPQNDSSLHAQHLHYALHMHQAHIALMNNDVLQYHLQLHMASMNNN